MSGVREQPSRDVTSTSSLLTWWDEVAPTAPTPVRPALLLVDADPSVERHVPGLADRHGVTVHRVAHTDARDVDALVRTSALAVDAAVDSGCDLLIASTQDDPEATARFIAVLLALTGGELIEALGLDHIGVAGECLDDAAWMHLAESVRSHLWRARRDLEQGGDAWDGSVGGTLLSTSAVLHRAAQRRTPVLLDGLGACTAALLARRMPDARVPEGQWWHPAGASSLPAHQSALSALEMTAPLHIDGPPGAAGVIAVALLRDLLALRPD